MHDRDFSDLAACTFWLRPGLPLSTYVMRGTSTKTWVQPTLSFYGATTGPKEWILLDSVSFRETPDTFLAGSTECVEAVAAAGAGPTATPVEVIPRIARPIPSQTAAVSVAGLASSGFTETAFGWRVEATTTGRRILSYAQSVDLTNAASARLRFRSWLTATQSSGHVEVSVGRGDWQGVTTVPTTSGWTWIDVDLLAFVGQIVDVRFVLDAVPLQLAVSPDVWQIEDVSIEIIERVSPRILSRQPPASRRQRGWRPHPWRTIARVGQRAR
jgi:hypothetical protein